MKTKQMKKERRETYIYACILLVLIFGSTYFVSSKMAKDTHDRIQYGINAIEFVTDVEQPYALYLDSRGTAYKTRMEDIAAIEDSDKNFSYYKIVDSKPIFYLTGDDYKSFLKYKYSQ